MVRHPGDVVMAAGEPGLKPTAEGALNIRQNLTETIDGRPPGLEHSIPTLPACLRRL